MNERTKERTNESISKWIMKYTIIGTNERRMEAIPTPTFNFTHRQTYSNTHVRSNTIGKTLVTHGLTVTYSTTITAGGSHTMPIPMLWLWLYYNYDDEVDGQLHMRTAYLPPLSSCKSNCCYGCVELLARSSFVGVDVRRRDCYRCSFMDSWMDCRRLIDSLRWNDIPWWHTTIPFSFCLPSQRICASV